VNLVGFYYKKVMGLREIILVYVDFIHTTGWPI